MKIQIFSNSQHCTVEPSDILIFKSKINKESEQHSSFKWSNTSYILER